MYELVVVMVCRCLDSGRLDFGCWMDGNRTSCVTYISYIRTCTRYFQYTGMVYTREHK